ncbi:MAG TPA: hypothetical protein VM123_04040 [archaeon]|nr:hypothetical protein [archaeon]
MRYLVLLTSAIFLFSASLLNAQKSPINFSGKWTLNAEKSDPGESSGRRRGGMPASKMNVEQKDNKLTVEDFRTNRDGEEVSTVSTYTLDGKECKNESSNRTSVSTASWSEDKKSLTISSAIAISRGGQEFNMKSTEIWSLTEGILTIKATRSSQMGERTTTAVYNKS